MSHADLATPADVSYLKTCSLTREPFSNTADDRFFYAGLALTQRLALLTHLIQFGDSVILVAGPHGSGKSTLLGRFASQAGMHWRLCLIDAEAFEHFHQHLGDTLGISDCEDIRQILERWASQTEASQLLVIAIDNAQRLPADAFRKLCLLRTPPLAERVRLILFGTPESQQALKQSFDQRELPGNAQLLEISRLDEKETAAYLMYRLAVAGYSGTSPFTATEVRALCKAADGRPGEINRLAHEALLEHHKSAHARPLRLHKKARMGMGLPALLVVVIAIFLGWQELKPVPVPTPAPQNTQAFRGIPLHLPNPVERRPITLVDKTTPGPAPDASGATATTALQPPRETGSPLPAASAEDTVAPPATPAPHPAHASRPLEKTVEATPVPTPKPEPLTRHQVRPPARPIPATRLPHDAAWLLQQPEQNYSLQLLGSRQAASIADYIRQHHLKMEKSATYRSTFKGEAWHVLMYGIFPNRQAALKARSRLPARVRKDKPWPRTLKSVQMAIREAQ